jgi:putative ABC transport system substrate-binding protein
LEEKRLELLRELVPSVARITLLGNSANPYSVLSFKRVIDLATSMGVQCDGINLNEVGGLENALGRLHIARPDGVLLPGVPALLPQRERITAFMAAERIPAVYPWPEFVEVGGLAVYATDFDDLFRQAAGYMDKILRGVAPAELPVQQAATFRMTINLRAANALGITVPQALLARADEVIE